MQVDDGVVVNGQPTDHADQQEHRVFFKRLRKQKYEMTRSKL